jgi:hypothetical protein
VDRPVSGDDRPDVDVDVDEILIDGKSYFGVLRDWRRASGSWLGNVIWNKAPGDNRLGWFPAERIRKLD